MRMKMAFGIAWLALATVVTADNAAETRNLGSSKNWPIWRGYGSQGVSPAKNVPTKWSATEGVRWKFALPGMGHCSPIVWGDKVFVTTAIPQGEEIPEGDPRRGRGQGPGGPPPTVEYKFMIYCLDLKSGKVLWEQSPITKKPREGVNKQKGSYANQTPATDGEIVFAYFGSQGLYCYDMAGKQLWTKQLGEMDTTYMNGEGSSCIIEGDKLLINWDGNNGAWITALDKKTGKEIWKTDRDEPNNCWASPVVVEHEGKKQIVVNATKKIRSYDLENGKMIWECGGMTRAVIPSVLYGHGMVYAASGYQGASFEAIKLGRTGDLTDSDAIAWKLDKNTPYVPTPVLYGDEVYIAKDNALLTCYDAKTGKMHYEPTRTPGITAVSSSLTAADGKVFVIGEDGKTVVLKAGPTLEVLSTNDLGERFINAPAIVDGAILLRGDNNLYCIGEKMLEVAK